MARARQISENFNSTQYRVDIYGPGGLRAPADSALPARYSQDALQLAAQIRNVHHRTLTEVGAEGLARQLSERPGTFYVARGVRTLSMDAYVYAMAHRGIGRSVLHVTGLEAFNFDPKNATPESQRDCRIAAATALHPAISAAVAERINGVRIHTRGSIAEGREGGFFTEQLGMELRQGLQWGDPGTYMVGDATAVLERIEDEFSVDPPR